jgi:carbon monoxide dehydrogenase subunit G
MICEASKLIPATPEAVWNLLSDLTRLKEWLPIEAEFNLNNGTQAAPGVVIGVKRPPSMGLIELEQHIDRADAPTLLAWRHEKEKLGGKAITQVKDFSTTIAMLPEGDNQTRVTIRSTWTPVGIMGNIASNMIKPRIQREFESALENIAQLAPQMA